MLYTAPDKLPYSFNQPSIFLAGGISNCPDWQSEIIQKLDTANFDVINPRRNMGFEKTGDSAKFQIEWEYNALKKVDYCTFWFPKETLCPITLYELGKMSMRASDGNVQIIVGWHEDYQRAFDLQVQLDLMGINESYIKILGPGWNNFVDGLVSRWGQKENSLDH